MTSSEGRSGRDVEHGYLSIPSAGRGPGIIVLQEWWGLVDHIRDVCDRLAREGFVALAPDLYRGSATSDPGDAERLMLDLDLARAEQDLGAAVSALLDHEAVDGAALGCIGFCMGGQLALHAAACSTRLAAVVDCYGIHPNVSLDFARIDAAVLGVFADNDAFVSRSAVDALEADLRAAGVRTHFRTYAGVDHAFLNDSRPDVHDAVRAREAWHDILSFLRAEL